MKIEHQIDEAQARIEALRLELALVESHKSRLQLAQNLMAELTGDIAKKMEELAALISPDCLVQAVDTITFEVEKTATLLLTPSYDESEPESLEAEENQEIKQYQPQYFDEEKKSDDSYQENSSPDGWFIGEIPPPDDEPFYGPDDDEPDNAPRIDPDRISDIIGIRDADKEDEAEEERELNPPTPTEIKLGDKVFKVGDRVTSSNPYTQKTVTGEIVAVGTRFTEADDRRYCGGVSVKDEATGEIEELSLSLVIPVVDEPTPKFKIGDRVKIPDVGKPGAILKSLKKKPG